jgi:hypothetical protein
MKKDTSLHTSGFTLVEIMLALFCFVVIGGIAYLLLNSGMILYAKNMSVNTAHEDTRRAINRMLRDIHAAVSVPQLIDGFNADGSLQVHTSNTTAAAGVSFQMVYTDPANPNDTGTHYIWKDPSSSSLIMIYNNGSCTLTADCPPFVGQRLIVPLWGIEADITKAQPSQSNSDHRNVYLMDEQGNIVDQTSANGKAPTGQGNSSNNGNNPNKTSNVNYAVCYYTNRVAYLVQGSQLRLYHRRYVGAGSSGTGGSWQWLNPRNFDTNGTVATGDTNGIVIARDITSATPFSAEWSNTAGVAAVSVTNGGSNYPNSTTVTISGGGGTGATATCTISGKVITGVTVTNPGSGYTSVPSVSFSGGSGSGAVGTVQLNTSPTTDDRYIHVTLTASDPTFSNRGYKTIGSLVDSAIPYRSRLCAIQ